MSKFQDATCVGSVVKVDGKPISATILSQGTKSSTGKAFMEKDKSVYVASNATDIADLITTLNDLITTLATTLTAMDAALLTPGAGTSGIAQIVTKNATLLTQKDNLK